MVTADEILNLQQGQAQEQDFKLARVVSLFEETGTAKIQFYGEDVPSEKEYSYLASYKPQAEDIVLVIPFADTYIIAGRILFQVTIPNDTVTEAMLNEALSSYATLDAIANFVTQTILNNTLAGYSENGHTHDQLDWGNYRAGFNYILNNVPQFIPSSTSIGLGAPNYKWKEIYAVAGAINTSDENLKNSIETLPDIYKKLILNLRPIIYKMNDGTSDRYHAGIGARETERIMKDLGIDSKDFAGLIKYEKIDEKGETVSGAYEYGLRYTEFIGPIMGVIQDQEKTINNLLERVEKLEKEGKKNGTGNI